MQSEDCPLFVDFGTCNTQIRVIHNGIVENPCRHGCIPSVVCVENGELQVVDSLYSCPRDGYALSVKRLLGKKKPELEAEGWTDAVHHCKVEFDAMQNPTLVLSYGMNGGSSLRVTPEDAVTVLLKKCKAVAEMHLKKPVTHCVLLVSNFSFQASRSALRSCAERAGLTVDSFVRESTAVGMGFGIAEEEHSILASKDLILVVDWGGAGLDLTLMHRKGNDFAVLGQGESSMLGGDSVDEVLCEYVQSRFRQDNNQELLNPASKFYRRRLGQLLRRCREAKEGVREHEGFSISLESPSHEEYALQLAPDAFARVIRGCVQCVEESVLALLQKCGKRVKDVRHVLLAGGSSNLQTLQHSLNRLFPDRVHVSESPQSLPVEGVALAYLRHVAGQRVEQHAGYRSGLFREWAHGRPSEVWNAPANALRQVLPDSSLRRHCLHRHLPTRSSRVDQGGRCFRPLLAAKRGGRVCRASGHTRHVGLYCNLPAHGYLHHDSRRGGTAIVLFACLLPTHFHEYSRFFA